MPEPARDSRESAAGGVGKGEGPEPARRMVRSGRRRVAGARDTPRDRPPERSAVHRPHQPVEARVGAAQDPQDAEERRMVGASYRSRALRAVLDRFAVASLRWTGWSGSPGNAEVSI